MSSMPSSSAGGGQSIYQQIAQIRVGMEVEDAAGAHVGKVTDLRIGDPDAIDVGMADAGIPGEGFALAMGAQREPNVPRGLVSRLLRIGYIKIDDKRHFRQDRHYYATADEIASIDGDTVRLGKAIEGLIVGLD